MRWNLVKCQGIERGMHESEFYRKIIAILETLGENIYKHKQVLGKKIT